MFFLDEDLLDGMSVHIVNEKLPATLETAPGLYSASTAVAWRKIGVTENAVSMGHANVCVPKFWSFKLS